MHMLIYTYMGFPGGTNDREPAGQCRRHERCGFEPWVGKTLEKGMVNPLQYSCLENSTDRGAWWSTVHRVTKSRTRLKYLSTCIHIYILSQVLVWYRLLQNNDFSSLYCIDEFSPLCYVLSC